MRRSSDEAHVYELRNRLTLSARSTGFSSLGALEVIGRPSVHTFNQTCSTTLLATQSRNLRLEHAMKLLVLLAATSRSSLCHLSIDLDKNCMSDHGNTRQCVKPTYSLGDHASNGETGCRYIGCSLAVVMDKRVDRAEKRRSAYHGNKASITVLVWSGHS